MSTRGRFFFHSCAEKLLPFAQYFEAYHHIEEAYLRALAWRSARCLAAGRLAGSTTLTMFRYGFWPRSFRWRRSIASGSKSKGCEKAGPSHGSASGLHIYLISLRSSARHWDTGKISWYDIVAFHKFMLSFDFGIAGIEVSIDHTMNGNRCGSGFWYTSMFAMPTATTALPGSDPESVWHFIDSTFALIVHRDGETFDDDQRGCDKGGRPRQSDPTANSNKGNRWLYKLPKPVFRAYALLRVLEACKASGGCRCTSRTA